MQQNDTTSPACAPADLSAVRAEIERLRDEAEPCWPILLRSNLDALLDIAEAAAELLEARKRYASEGMWDAYNKLEAALSRLTEGR